jgi:beta-xylosidase
MSTVTIRKPPPATRHQSHLVLPRLALAILLAPHCGHAAARSAPATYDNPILYADYSDPDVVRFGTHYYLIASTFHFSPGIPVLESNDLVHWSIVGHVLHRLDFHPSYDLPGPLDFSDATEHSKSNYALGYRYASGIWAPAIRAYNGRLYVYFVTPTEGIFMTSAAHATGPWEAPVKVIDQPGLEDPCPFWDEDGQAYLVHSKVGAGPLILHRMSADGKNVLDDGEVIMEDPVRLPTLEGPKLYKRNGYYYIFAPFGGVEHGSQAVLRSRDIYGPYEVRTVLSEGSTAIQGPHQGGYVETPSGEGWFVHFNSTGAYGRIVYLEPVRWVDDWPVIGAPPGQPVLSYAAPDVGRTFPAIYPQTSDEFNRRTLSPQWEWNHNPLDSHWSLTERPGFLRLQALPAPDLVSARNTLTQVLQGPSAQITTKLAVSGMVDGQRAGLAMFGRRPSWIGVVQNQGQRHLTFAVGGSETSGPVLDVGTVILRMQVAAEQARYSFSIDAGKTFQELGSPAPLFFSWWKAARPALFTFNSDPHASRTGLADFDWLRVRLP